MMSLSRSSSSSSAQADQVDPVARVEVGIDGVDRCRHWCTNRTASSGGCISPPPQVRDLLLQVLVVVGDRAALDEGRPMAGDVNALDAPDARGSTRFSGRISDFSWIGMRSAPPEWLRANDGWPKHVGGRRRSSFNRVRPDSLSTASRPSNAGAYAPCGSKAWPADRVVAEILAAAVVDVAGIDMGGDADRHRSGRSRKTPLSARKALPAPARKRLVQRLHRNRRPRRCAPGRHRRRTRSRATRRSRYAWHPTSSGSSADSAPAR